MEKTLDRLCAHFEDELERQENVLALCNAQAEAARARDIECLEAKTAALSVLIQDAIDAERERLALVREIVDAYGLPVEQQTLSGLVATVPEPWKTRLADFQLRIRAVLEETRGVVRQNMPVLRRSLNVANEALSALHGQPDAGRYDGQGENREGALAGPNVIDRRG